MKTGPWTAFASALANDHLLARMLRLQPLRDAKRERHMTSVRRRCLLGGGAPIPLLTHLALQCFLNEYAWFESEAETAAVAALWDEASRGALGAQQLLLLACYRSLGDLPNAAALPRHGEAAEVIAAQVADVLEERRLRELIPALTPIVDETSQTVREMYEANPYPRWREVSSATRPAPKGVSDVLIAGCGTGRHPIQAAYHHAGAKVLSVDLSRASLAYAQRKANEHGVDNLTLAQADMLELPRLGLAFDHIEAAGSLQCMEDPARGLAALVAMLRPRGKIVLGLYSERARRPLAAAQALGKTFPHTTEGIRAYRAQILAAGPGDPLAAALEWPDFYSVSMCRDLLLHVKEHVHTIPQIKALLDDAGLAFGGFLQADHLMADYRARFPDDPDGVVLDNWTAFEAERPATFRRMYQFWARKPGG